MIELAGGVLMMALILVILPAIASVAVAVAVFAAVVTALALAVYALPEVGEPLAVGGIVVFVLGSPFWGLQLYDRVRRRSAPGWHL